MARKGAAKKDYDLQEALASGAKRSLPKGLIKSMEGIREKSGAVNAETKAIVGLCNQRRVDVMLGKVSYRQAPSVLKAVDAVMDEIYGPLAKDVNVKGVLTLEQLVARAEAKLSGSDQ